MRADSDHALMLLTKAANALDEIEDLGEVVKIRDHAEALRSLGKRFELAEEIALRASTIKVKAERRLGELLAKLPLHPGGKPAAATTSNRLQHSTGLKLSDLGISRSDSSRWQKIAQLPKAKFNAFVHSEVEANRLPTTNGVLREAKRYLATERVKSLPQQEGYVTQLAELIDEKRTFTTIYADPPWPYRNRSSNGAANNHYPTLSMDDILAEPVKELVGPSGHLHLWCPASFLEEGLAVIKAWGFVYKSYFVWIKETIGTGNYYRRADELMLFGNRTLNNDQEMLLLGTRGGEGFLDHTVRSWQKYPRREHSRKPDEVREMVEKVSPGPYLELYSRSQPKRGWTHYGNQIVRS
ncbi:MT-A70 family methyltransferase [Bythopirellula goksoeyrii]|uniref:MT-A70 n=1 Tax=Bythopirellula goksoeyrii TaxID=1400387 RepID=A0A5B9QGS7_9BACT|nr:MT-A70 family methyltransferase [Bythopirellula goksoeyrii]QEG36156.1 hypothetical protein Pr1d_34650 [Bythopirellula goksoeyrii]